MPKRTKTLKSITVDAELATIVDEVVPKGHLSRFIEICVCKELKNQKTVCEKYGERLNEIQRYLNETIKENLEEQERVMRLRKLILKGE